MARIERVTIEHDEAAIAAALDVVLGGLPDDVRPAFTEGLMATARLDSGALGELWRAVSPAGSTVGAVWAQLRPGDTAIVWPPRWLTAVGTDEPDPLLRALMASLTTHGIKTAQSLVADRAAPEVAVMQRSGFRPLAELCYMAAPAVHKGVALPFDLESPDSGAFERLVAVVDETYRDTLDCPALDGVRCTADVLNEYRTIGTGGDALWRVVHSAGRDVGCLLLADHPAQDQLELVYMGLVPEVRGRMWGAALVDEAMRLAQERRRARVVLAVDAANGPALAMYQRAGFTTFDTRTALLFRAAAATEKT